MNNDDKEETLIAVVAHPDDELMILGTLIQCAQRSNKVALIWMTSGDYRGSNKVNRHRIASSFLTDNLIKIECNSFYFPDQLLDTVPMANLVGRLDSELKRFRELYNNNMTIITHCEDSNFDHCLTLKAVEAALRRSRDSLLTFEVVGNVSRFNPNMFIKIDENSKGYKLKLLKKYMIEYGEIYPTETNILSKMKAYGSMINSHGYYEALEIKRVVI